jgi:DNA invertase Pin-like site-specific DNA recombinase
MKVSMNISKKSKKTNKTNKNIKIMIKNIKKNINKNTIKDDIKDVIIYCRVSTPEQDMKAQEYACAQYCMQNDYIIKYAVNETGSAYKMGQTPKLDNLIKNNSNFILLVNRIDRFSRNLIICDANLKIMKDNNIILKSVNDYIDLSSPIGRHTFRNNISQCQLESETIGERIKSSIKYRIENGLFVGVPKFGYKMENNNKIQDKYEQSIIKFISDNLYKTKTSNAFSKDLFKVLKNTDKTKDFYVNVIFADKNGNDVPDSYITTSIISDILNEYELFKRGKEWNPKKIRNLNNSILNDFNNLNIQ